MPNVTCPRCREKLENCPKNSHGWPLADQVYDVGNVSKVEMGHQYYHSKSGRVALCIAAKKAVETTTH